MFVALLALSLSAFADAPEVHVVDDLRCFIRGPREICQGLDGVTHLNESASGNVNRFIIGDRWMTVALDRNRDGVYDDYVLEQYISGHLHEHSRDGETTGFHLDQCVTTDEGGESVSIDMRLQIVDGEVIYDSIEEVESCN